MSGKLAGLIWDSALPKRLKALAVMLADRAKDNGSGIRPSVANMAWRLSDEDNLVDATQVFRGLKELQDMGVLVAVENDGGGRGRTVEYRLVEAKLPRRRGWRVLRASTRKGGADASVSKGKKGGADASVLEGDADDDDDEKGGAGATKRVAPTQLKGGVHATPIVRETSEESGRFASLEPEGSSAGGGAASVPTSQRGAPRITANSSNLQQPRRDGSRARTAQKSGKVAAASAEPADSVALATFRGLVKMHARPATAATILACRLVEADGRCLEVFAATEQLRAELDASAPLGGTLRQMAASAGFERVAIRTEPAP